MVEAWASDHVKEFIQGRRWSQAKGKAPSCLGHKTSTDSTVFGGGAVRTPDSFGNNVCQRHEIMIMTTWIPQ
ncbi:hypothetical protein NPIL_348681 [Nephila pilipes]|uniref:Uncharacterized protein n=1 Tax=Nephila pilipes TaxID=299642 RepID=A0A8X6QFW6_NEPPI|nr:hypothetical protein NPIL_348681 [Nephila pilipes]